MKTDCDTLAGILGWYARVARAMPPTFLVHGQTIPVLTREGQLGALLPGVGLQLHDDYRALGLTRALPGVIERSWAQRVLDLLHSQQGAINIFADIRAGRVTDQHVGDVSLTKTPAVSASNWTSLFRAAGSPIGAGTYTNIPGGAALTRATVGAWSQLLTNPPAGKKKYFVGLGMSGASATGALLLVDLLVAAGNIVTTTTAPQTVNSVALPRVTDGRGVMMTFEVTAALDATATNLTVSYTNDAGVAGRATPASALTTGAGTTRLQPASLGAFMELQSGDTGVQSVQSATLSTTQGTGQLALNLYYPIAFCPALAAGTAIERISPHHIDALTLLPDTAQELGCLTGYMLTPQTTTFILRTVAK